MGPRDECALRAIVPVGWYDLSLYARLLRTLEKVHGRNDLSLLAELGYYSAQQDLTTIHRLFMRVANPGLIMDKATQLWRRFHDTGIWHIQRPSSTSVIGTLAGWGVVDAALCREITGYIQGIVEVGNGKDAKAQHTSCRGLGAADCVFAAAWR